VYGSYGDDSPYASGAPSLRRAGSDPFKRIYEDQLGAQYGMMRQISQSNAEKEAAKYGAAPTSSYTRPSFSDGFMSRLASSGPELASGLASGLRGLFSRGPQFPGSPGTGVSGIGPVASGSTYGNWLNATSGTSGIGPWSSGDAYGHALSTYRGS